MSMRILQCVKIPYKMLWVVLRDSIVKGLLGVIHGGYMGGVGGGAIDCG